MMKRISIRQRNCWALVRSFISQNQRISYFFILILSIMIMTFFGKVLFERILNRSPDSSQISWLIDININVDVSHPFPNQIKFHTPILRDIRKDQNWSQQIHNFLSQVSPHFRGKSTCTNYWVVVVDMSENALETAERLPNWCFVIVVENQDYDDNVDENVFILNKTIRHELAKISTFYRDSLRLPNDLYNVLKNLGYLWAIFHEATAIYDFDRIVETVLNKDALILSLNEKVEVLQILNHNGTMFNPYLFFKMNMTRTWPRGYPFQFIWDEGKPINSTKRLDNAFLAKHLGVINSLTTLYFEAHLEYQMIKHDLPLIFYNVHTNTYKDLKLLVPLRSFSPYDQQTTLHFRLALWALLLPVTVQQDASDIFRSYTMQRLMWDVNLRIAFTSSFIKKKSRPYNGKGKTMNHLPFRKSEHCCPQESSYYWKVDKIIRFLNQWSTNHTNFIERIEQLFIDLHKQNYIQMMDLHLTRLWLQELYRIGYIFPEITST